MPTASASTPAAVFTARASSEAAATGDVMLLHVHQGEKPASAAFSRRRSHSDSAALKLSADESAAGGAPARARSN